MKFLGNVQTANNPNIKININVGNSNQTISGIVFQVTKSADQSPFFNSMKHIFFLFSITTVAFAATRRCPRIPSTHCASLHNDVTCSGWSHKVRKMPR